MAELRGDPIVGRWVIVAPERAARPSNLAPVPRLAAEGPCPFCPGHEQQTPGELAAGRDAGGSDSCWQWRVVPNKYPAVGEGGPAPGGSGLFPAAAAIGRHEVIVETPRHVASLAELTWPEARALLEVYRDRLAAAREDRRLEYGLIFKNVGAAAGATLYHAHSQVIGLPVVPVHVAAAEQGAQAWRTRHGGCIYCRLAEEETAVGARSVAQADAAAVYCPFAGRLPYETWLVPRRHGCPFWALSATELDGLADQLYRLAIAVDRALERPAYNLVLLADPLRAKEEHCHWHLELLPRLTNLAGFEWGTGCFVNPVPPEEAAARLREAWPDGPLPRR